jgi:hypothetical protein
MRIAIEWLALMSVLWFVWPADAAPVIWHVQGEVIEVTNAPSSLTSLGVEAGTPYTAIVVLESDASDSNLSPEFGSYDGASLAMDFTAAGYHASAGPIEEFSSVFVNVDQQAFLASMGPNGLGDLFSDPFLLMRVQAVPGTFLSDAMPLVPVPIDDLIPPGGSPFGGTVFVVSGNTEAGQVQILANIYSWVSVPEPEVVSVLAVAIAALFGGRISYRPGRQSHR